MKKTFPNSILTLITLFVIMGAGHVRAAQESPESAAKAYFASTREGNWAKCASLMHPEALASIKRMFATVIKGDKSGDAARTMFKLKSGAEYAQLGEAAVFERLMDFITTLAPEMKEEMATSTTTILGKVDEGPDLAHVVYRTQFKTPGAEVSEVDLISFKKHGGTWRASLTPDMEEILNLAEEMISDSKEEENSAPAGDGRPTRKP
jgi:hypothetical protein